MNTLVRSFLLSASALVTVAMAAAAQVRDTVVVVPGADRVEIIGQKGAIVVEAWESDSVEVRVRAHRGIRVEVKRDSRRVEVQSSRPAQLALEDADVWVRVPARTELLVRGRANAITVDGVRAPVELWSQSGTVVGRDLQGGVTVRATTGDVVIEGSSGSITVDATAGRVRLEGSSGSARVETVAGDITVVGGGFSRAELSSNGGAIRYTADMVANGRYDLASQDGGVELVLPPGLAGARFEIGTVTGHLDVLPGSAAPREATGEISTFDLDAGGPTIRIVTFSGPIRVRRAAR